MTPASTSELVTAAVGATELSVVVCDARLPDLPIVYVNPAFEQLTGYGLHRVEGRNCRFLQGPGTDPAHVDALRRILPGGRGEVTLLNYRADGTPFWNRLQLSPIHGADGELTHVVGVLRDVSAEVDRSADQEQALLHARQARAASERAVRELAYLGELAERVSYGSLPERIERLTGILAPALADRALVRVCFSDAHYEHARGLDPAEVTRLVQDAERATPTGPTSGRLRELRTERAVVFTVPIVASDGRRLGDIIVESDPGRPLVGDEGQLLDRLGRRAGLKLENAWLADLQHTRAIVLQRSLLPHLPEVPGLEVAAEYLPGSHAAEVGGDWYDVLALPQGGTGLVIGDVTGHDMFAAAMMGQYRSLLRAAAWREDSTSATLDRVNELAIWLAIPQLASCLYARWDGATLHYSSAGHPPPIVIDPAGGVRLLDDAVSPLLGVDLRPLPGTGRPEGRVALAPGSLVVLYSDGTVESRTRSLDVGIEELARAAAEHRDDPLEQLAARLITVTDDPAVDDDRCLLLVRIGGE